jgi:hypothetical protein
LLRKQAYATAAPPRTERDMGIKEPLWNLRMARAE